jgi:hypothetical protein
MRDHLPPASGRRQENCAVPTVTRLFELRRGCSASCVGIRSTATAAVSGSATTWRAEYMCFRKERMEPPLEPGGGQGRRRWDPLAPGLRETASSHPRNTRTPNARVHVIPAFPAEYAHRTRRFSGHNAFCPLSSGSSPGNRRRALWFVRLSVRLPHRRVLAEGDGTAPAFVDSAS